MARARLREAALSLYRERGYDATTTAQIAAHAGVTERTYFRHFADKREVLFDGETELRDTLVAGVAGAPAGLSPLVVLQRAFTAAIPLFVAGRRIAELREPIIAATPALQERAHAKKASLVTAIAQALQARGMAPENTCMAAQVGMAMFTHALRHWGGTSARELEKLLAKAVADMRDLG